MPAYKNPSFGKRLRHTKASQRPSAKVGGLLLFQMKHAEDSLTAVSYAQHYADQAHFTNTVKNITGLSPQKIRKKMPDFRFLQF